MPMKKVSTFRISKLSARVNMHEADSYQEAGPSNQTLDFLRQFARSYHAEPSLNTNICGFVLN